MNADQTKILETEINHTLRAERFLVITAILESNGEVRTHVTDHRWPLEKVDKALHRIRDHIFGTCERKLASGIIVPGVKLTEAP